MCRRDRGKSLPLYSAAAFSASIVDNMGTDAVTNNEGVCPRPRISEFPGRKEKGREGETRRCQLEGWRAVPDTFDSLLCCRQHLHLWGKCFFPNLTHSYMTIEVESIMLINVIYSALTWMLIWVRSQLSASRHIGKLWTFADHRSWQALVVVVSMVSSDPSNVPIPRSSKSFLQLLYLQTFLKHLRSCTSLPGVALNAATCLHGQCRAFRCDNGYTLTNDHACVADS